MTKVLRDSRGRFVSNGKITITRKLWNYSESPDGGSPRLMAGDWLSNGHWAIRKNLVRNMEKLPAPEKVIKVVANSVEAFFSDEPTEYRRTKIVMIDGREILRVWRSAAGTCLYLNDYYCEKLKFGDIAYGGYRKPMYNPDRTKVIMSYDKLCPIEIDTRNDHGKYLIEGESK